MITEDNKQSIEGLNRGVSKDMNINAGNKRSESMENSKEVIEKPVNNEGVATSKTDLHLEKQWLAVRDEYLAHYPDADHTGTEYDNRNFSSIIDSIAKRRQRTSKEIRDEIMEWSSTK